MHIVLFSLVCLIWGASFLLMKKAGLAFGPVSIGALRVFGGAAVLGLVWLVREKGWPFKRADLPALLFAVLIGYVWPYTMQPYLVAHHESGFIGMMVSFTPLLTIVVSVPMLGQYPTARQLSGVLGGLACMGVIMSDGLDRNVPWQNLCLAVTVPLVYAITNTFIKRRFAAMSSLALTLSSLSLASVLLLPAAALKETVHTGEQFGTALASVALLGVVGTGAAIFMFYKLVQERGPLFAGMVTYLVPVGAITLGWFDGEAVTWRQVGALVGILLMVALVQTDSRHDKQSSDPTGSASISPDAAEAACDR